MGQRWEVGEESIVYFQLKLEIPVRHPVGDAEETFGNKSVLSVRIQDWKIGDHLHMIGT